MIASYFVIIPLVTAFLIVLFGRKAEKIAGYLSLFATIILMWLSALLFPIINIQGAIVYQLSDWKIPYTISLVIDHLSAFMMIIISLIALLSIIYSINYVKKFTSNWGYYSLFMLLLAGLNGVTITGDLFNLFVFMEIALIATYALVAFQGKAEHYEASFKYAIMGSISSTLILFGIGCVYSMTSSLTMMQISAKSGSTAGLYLLSALFLTGFGLKSAMFPLHSWLPDAHPSAPSPVSAMLSGVLIKVLGAYAIIRVFYMVLEPSKMVNEVLLLFGTLSMFVGAIMAIAQKDIKRMLGFSSVSQMGYILLGIGLATPLGFLGAIYHILNHAVLKSLLFLDAGAIEEMEGTRNLEKMQGNTEPITKSTTYMGALGISGVPPFGGFFSKLIIIVAAISSGRYIYAIIGLIVGVMTLGYYLGMLKKAFKEKKEPKKIGISLKISLVILACLTLVTALLFVPGLREGFLNKVVDCITDREAYAALFKVGAGL